jgi:hypothetical protein
LEWIGELKKAVGLLESYLFEGKEFWRVTGWHHQKIDKPTYLLPRFTEIRRAVARCVDEDSSRSSPPESKGVGREWSGRERKGVEWKGANV